MFFSADFQTFAELCSSGKSGSFFYFTMNNCFLLKTIPRHEFKLMKTILKNYHTHITDNPETLISKCYGIHKVIFHSSKYKSNKKIYFCVQDNVFRTPLKIDLRYDLKGSLYGRRTIDPALGYNADRTIALKD